MCDGTQCPFFVCVQNALPTAISGHPNWWDLCAATVGCSALEEAVGVPNCLAIYGINPCLPEVVLHCCNIVSVDVTIAPVLSVDVMIAPVLSVRWVGGGGPVLEGIVSEVLLLAMHLGELCGSPAFCLRGQVL